MSTEVRLNNAIAQKLRRMQSTISDVPPPAHVWEWEDVETVVGQSDLQYLESRGLVVRVSRDLWRSTRRLENYMKSVYGVSLEGDAGQETLPICTERIVWDHQASRESRESRQSRTRSRQIALDGGDPRSSGPDWSRDMPFTSDEEDEAQECLREAFSRVS